jgi:mono/diheme cytochrome c family protein
VTEIPEHLLRRSKERRAALGGDAGAEGAATAEASETVAKAASPVVASAPVAAVPASGAPPVEPPPPTPRLGPTRARIPLWIMPVLVGLPLWGIVYLGAFGSRVKANANDPVTLGGTLFAQNCSSCHGANGQGGVGPQLSAGLVVKNFPAIADHLKWVHTGGAPYVGKTVPGALGIPVPANNVMPAFGTANGGSLSDDQIAQIVCYERVSLGGETESAKNCPGFTG